MQSPRDRRRGQEVLLEDGKPVIDGFAMAREANIAKAGNHNVAITELPGKLASAEKTRTAVRGSLTPEAMEQLLSLMASDIGDNEADLVDTDGPPEPRDVGTLPAVISTAIANTDDSMIVPEWHQVKNLPGYQANAIRALGRQIFNIFTDTPIEDIQCCTTLSNDENEVKAMMAWIKQNGVCNEKMRMDFEELMPEYAPLAQHWDVEGFSFLLVKDNHGHYVYGWPGGRGVHLEQEPPRPMLR